MSYLYDKLKEVLGGSNFKSGIVNTTWSPNEVRALFIMTNYIMVVDFIKQPKVMMLNINEVAQDIQNPNRRGYLNNVLSSRQLSCLEEIYVSHDYMKYPQVIGLQEYINSLVGQSSRLRRWGYILEPNIDELRKIYHSVIMNGKMDFLYTKEARVGGSVSEVENNDWYKKHNLRPEFYALDKERGSLHAYFMKCENIVGESIKVEEEKGKLLSVVNSICSMYKIDCALAGRLSRLLKFLIFCNKNSESPIKDIAGTIYSSILRKDIVAKGMSRETFMNSMKAGKMSISNNNEKYMLDAYSKFGVYDKDDSNRNDIVYNDDGIFQLRKRIDLGLYESLISYGREYKPVFSFALMRCKNSGGFGLPDGKFVKELGKRNMLKVDISGGVDDLIEFVYNICGYTEEDFIGILRKVNGGN